MKRLYVLAIATCALVGFAGKIVANENDANPSDIVRTIESLGVETIVTVSGTVKRIRDEDEFILEDETDSISVYIGPNFMPVEPGDKVTVKGMFDNDIIKREIYAHIITDEEGNITKLERRYE